MHILRSCCILAKAIAPLSRPRLDIHEIGNTHILTY